MPCLRRIKNGHPFSYSRNKFRFAETILYFKNISKLLDSFSELVNSGHTVIIIEHNLDIIKCADHIIDIGPEGGFAGGQIVGEGTPEEIVQVKESYTGKYLKQVL